MNKYMIIFLLVTRLVYSQNMKYFDIQNNTVISGASEPGVVWDDDEIHIMNLPTEPTGPSDVNYNQLIAIRDISAAIDLWHYGTNYTIYDNDFDPDEYNNNIVILWSNNPIHFDNPAKDGAKTQYSNYTSPHFWNYENSVFLNKTDNRNFSWWTDRTQPSSSFTSFYSAVLHELGHVIGLQHSGNSSAVMWPNIDPVLGFGMD